MKEIDMKEIDISEIVTAGRICKGDRAYQEYQDMLKKECISNDRDKFDYAFIAGGVISACLLEEMIKIKLEKK